MYLLISYVRSHEKVERQYTDIVIISAAINNVFLKSLSWHDLMSVFSLARSESQGIFLLYQKDVGLDRYRYILCG